MALRDLDVWALELTDYFMKSHGYKLVTLSQEISQTWLINENEAQVPIIMISAQSIKEVNRFEIKQIHATLSLLVKTTRPGLFITVNEQDFDDADDFVLVTPTRISDTNFATRYPKIQGEMHPLQNVNLQRARTVIMDRIHTRMRKEQQRSMIKNTMGTMIVIILALIGFIATNYLISQGVTLELSVVMLGAYYKPLISKAYEFWRFLTPMFLHASFIHLLMNVYALRSIGRILEPRLKTGRYLLILFLGVIMGNVFVFLREDSMIGVGMSAGIYALFGAFAIMMYETDMYKNPLVRNQMISIIGVNLFISLLPNVSFTAHAGGLFVGIFFGFIFSRRQDWATLRKGTLAIFCLTCVGLVGMVLTRNHYIEPSMFDLNFINTVYEFGFKDYALHLRNLLLK
ncbi:hypothetical protein AOC36_07695 [Erysipelothrix larvae]|uniref:Peptidase S54 rhomboid domain-containing protein n=1 Tax=Erysipelothrix larvae TaxID=1514105 RepID=A0A0X8H0Z1_9FIRM|nr:rhomboid family intramembrane serine protease [Erysipelothrix larvae]AMC93869.1 hypothetical protein AOC36_07695 [Erysipelothrix larvae]